MKDCMANKSFKTHYKIPRNKSYSQSPTSLRPLRFSGVLPLSSSFRWSRLKVNNCSHSLALQDQLRTLRQKQKRVDVDITPKTFHGNVTKVEYSLSTTGIYPPEPLRVMSNQNQRLCGE